MTRAISTREGPQCFVRSTSVFGKDDESSLRASVWSSRSSGPIGPSADSSDDDAAEDFSVLPREEAVQGMKPTALRPTEFRLISGNTDTPLSRLSTRALRSDFFFSQKGL